MPPDRPTPQPAPDVLVPDTALELPRITVLRASAGSGKTWTLTQRYVQLALSQRVPKNGLASLLAITFSNNATREMKEQVLEWLKRIALGDADRIAAMGAIVEGGGLPDRTADLLEHILDGWSDFQIRTIDSFMNSVFRGAAIGFGYSPEMETTTRLGPIVDYAFELFLREAGPGSPSADLLEATIRSVLANRGDKGSFAWDPVTLLRGTIASLEGVVSELERPLATADAEPAMRGTGERIAAEIEAVDALVRTSGLESSAKSKLGEALALARDGRFTDLLGTSLRTCPVKKGSARTPDAAGRYEEIVTAWAMVQALVGRYAVLWARSYWAPAIRLRDALQPVLRTARRVRGAVHLGDVKRELRDWLDAGAVPDVYFQLGEKVHHWLIDEFQDTSPLQWKILFPLVENSLASGGSLFVVGDTKQAIYGFRQADWRIMHQLATENPFPSVPHHESPELYLSRRSRPRVLALAEGVFRAAGHSDQPYGRRVAAASGLTTYRQEAVDPDRDPGHAEVVVLDRDDESLPELRKLRDTVCGLRSRGWRASDIAVLAPTNDAVVRAAAALAADGVPVLSSSSLDARARPAVTEVLALLAFLDSPPDDLAFAGFLLGGLFTASAGRAYPDLDPDGVRRFLFASRGRHPLYKEFQLAFPEAWSRYLGDLFRATGYLPLYDLVCRALSALDAFTGLPGEEAAFARLLEAVKAFEGSGLNSLHAFLASAREEGGDEWDIVAPPGIDAVRVMTVHKAKGLGFPVVVLLQYGQGYKADPWAVVRGGDTIELVRVNEELAKLDPILRQIQDAQKDRFWVERLNALYVALTRAKREMYVIGARGGQNPFPFDLLPVEEFPEGGANGPAPVEARPEEKTSPIAHEAALQPPVAADGGLSYAERARGDFIHKVLALITTTDDLNAVLNDAIDQTVRRERLEVAPVIPDLAGTLHKLDLSGWFLARPDREVYTEREFCDERGRLLRMDRLVVDPDRVLLLDWKTGREEIGSPEQETQVRAYVAILRQVYPGRTIEALLVQLDERTTRSVA
jgi:ATP-dependent helicase/nuclease subunit A